MDLLLLVAEWREVLRRSLARSEVPQTDHTTTTGRRQAAREYQLRAYVRLSCAVGSLLPYSVFKAAGETTPDF